MMDLSERKASADSLLPGGLSLSLLYDAVLDRLRREGAGMLKEQDTERWQVAARESGIIIMLDGNAEIMGFGRTVKNSAGAEGLKVRFEAAGARGPQKLIEWSARDKHTENGIQWTFM